MSGSGGELRVDLDGLHAAAARAGLAPTGAGVALPPLTPCAADVASHTAARRLGLRAAAAQGVKIGRASCRERVSTIV